MQQIRCQELDNIVDFVKVANAQESNPELKQILKDGSALQLQKIYVLSTFELPSARFLFVHIDLIAPIPISKGYHYCLTAVDRYTRWSEAMPITVINAETVATALLTSWISRFGCPTDFVIECGKQFESTLFQHLARVAGVHHRRKTTYHPACNGLVKRFHRQLKTAIMCHANEHWTESLPLVLLDERSAYKEDLKTSCAVLVYGKPSGYQEN
ncbi:hypothetical protein EVAR_44010_1 [Eumeta japonica]|uniref:Integrase catalytic domain-containing protein n=1 Tax=Eumeta variegata TaxID=151549 RepID=A0A4C1XGX5_EUMVA|nr:hypothetical protein EVAR_44010_1 [Eumeta japonica]